MSTLRKLARLVPSSLLFQKSTFPALRIDGFIEPSTYLLRELGRVMWQPCWKRFLKIRIKLQFWSILRVAAMHRHTLFTEKLNKSPKGTKHRSGPSHKILLLMPDSCFSARETRSSSIKPALWVEWKSDRPKCWEENWQNTSPLSPMPSNPPTFPKCERSNLSTKQRKQKFWM